MDQVDDDSNEEGKKKSPEEWKEMAQEAEKQKKFPQATYYYYQGYDPDKEVAMFNQCGDEWPGLREFMNSLYERGDIDEGTPWESVVELYKKKDIIEKAYKSRLYSLSEIDKVCKRCCKIHIVPTPSSQKHKTDDEEDENPGHKSGTGFLAQYKGIKFIVTNHHVLKEKDRTFVAEFKDNSGSPVFTYLNTNFVCNKEYDVGLASFSNKNISKRDYFDLEQLGTSDGSNAIVIFQHPRGEELHQSIGVIINEDSQSDELDYTASTDGGSSGSFVFTSEWKPIALHKMGVGGMFGANNRGTKFTSVVSWLESKYDEIKRTLGSDKSPEEVVLGNQERQVQGTAAKLHKEIVRMQNAICQIVTPQGSGGGFLAVVGGKKFIVTATSVISEETDLSSSCAYFSVWNSYSEFSEEDPQKAEFISDERMVNTELGVTLLGFKCQSNLNYFYHYHMVKEKLGSIGGEESVFKENAVVLFQRPSKATGENNESKITPIHQSIGTIKKLHSNGLLRYDAPAGEGSHGGIVLSAEWKPIAIHITEKTDLLVNEGTLLANVIDWIEKEKPLENFASFDQMKEIPKEYENGKTIADLHNKFELSEELIQSSIDDFLDPVLLEELDEDDRFLIRTMRKKKKHVKDIAKKLGRRVDLIEKYDKKLKLLDVFDEDDKILLKFMGIKKKKEPKVIAKKLGKSVEAVEMYLSILKKPSN